MIYLYVMKKAFGLTAIELVAIIVSVTFAVIIFLYQMANIEASQRDEDRKTAINAMYYNLEEVFYKKNGYYPQSISSDLLTAMDPKLFTDPQGNLLGLPDSDYKYDAVDCQADKCSSYKLTARLDKEAGYIKTNRN